MFGTSRERSTAAGSPCGDACRRAAVRGPGRSEEVSPSYGIDVVPGWPYDGSLFEVWDIGPLHTEGGQTRGTPPPPQENVPNREGVDPHGPDASEQITGRLQISEFLKPDGVLIDVCGPHPCYLAGWTGP